MEVETIEIDKLKPYENNPRNNDAAVKYVANSIKNFGFKVPIVIDKNCLIIAGHTRYKAAVVLGLSSVPCIIADDLSKEQVKAFRLADNKVSEIAEWDLELLNDELKILNELDFDMEQFNFDTSIDFDNIEASENSPYTSRIEIPQYLITDEKPSENELVDDTKTKELIKEIQAKELPADIQKFLIYGAYRHLVFDYGNIAEYYAHADEEVQELFERSALVIIDYDNAIANGYVRLHSALNDLRDNDE